MSLLKKQVVSEKAIIIWFVCTVFSGIVFMFICGFVIFLIYGCFPVRGSISEGGKTDAPILALRVPSATLPGCIIRTSLVLGHLLHFSKDP